MRGSLVVPSLSPGTRRPSLSHEARGFPQFQDDLDLLLERERSAAPPLLLLAAYNSCKY